MVANTMTTSSPEETIQLGKTLAGDLRGGEVLALYGPLGAGKTTLVKGIAEGLGVDRDEVRSPTFVLVRSYEGKAADGTPLTIHHLDSYRLEGGGAFDDIGGLDLMNESTVCIIEWADRVVDGLPEKRIDISLEHVDPTTRTITIR